MIKFSIFSHQLKFSSFQSFVSPWTLRGVWKRWWHSRWEETNRRQQRKCCKREPQHRGFFQWTFSSKSFQESKIIWCERFRWPNLLLSSKLHWLRQRGKSSGRWKCFSWWKESSGDTSQSCKEGGYISLRRRWKIWWWYALILGSSRLLKMKFMMTKTNLVYKYAILSN